MIDLFSILFSTVIVVMIIFRAIIAERASNRHSEPGNDFGALYSARSRTSGIQ
jgi:hypothetical protein